MHSSILRKLVPGVKAEEYTVNNLSPFNLALFLAAKSYNELLKYDILKYGDIFDVRFGKDGRDGVTGPEDTIPNNFLDGYHGRIGSDDPDISMVREDIVRTTLDAKKTAFKFVADKIEVPVDIESRYNQDLAFYKSFVQSNISQMSPILMNSFNNKIIKAPLCCTRFPEEQLKEDGIDVKAVIDECNNSLMNYYEEILDNIHGILLNTIGASFAQTIAQQNKTESFAAYITEINKAVICDMKNDQDWTQISKPYLDGDNNYKQMNHAPNLTMHLIYDKEKMNPLAQTIFAYSGVFWPLKFIVSAWNALFDVSYNNTGVLLVQAKKLMEMCEEIKNTEDSKACTYQFAFWALLILAVDKTDYQEKLSLICNYASLFEIPGDELEDIARVVNYLVHGTKQTYTTMSIPKMFSNTLTMKTFAEAGIDFE